MKLILIKKRIERTESPSLILFTAFVPNQNPSNGDSLPFCLLYSLFYFYYLTFFVFLSPLNSLDMKIHFYFLSDEEEGERKEESCQTSRRNKKE